MKKIYTILAVLLVTGSTFAQAPEKMSYQAVVRDAANTLVTNQVVGMRITILQGKTPVYEERQTPTTNVNGLVTLEIGGSSATEVSGTFSTIDWSAGPYFIKTKTDPSGGSRYTIGGTSQLTSVPYALYAKTSGNGVGPAGADGAAGTNGINGEKGDTGATGTAGADGATGATGSAGENGANGNNWTSNILNPSSTYPGVAVGDQWLNTTSGDVFEWDGSTWNGTGNIQGANGATGPAGTQGDIGATGAQGDIGATGADGNNGATGSQGIQGDTGATGSQGDIGATGAQGDIGATGATGADGAQGTQGETGAAGLTTSVNDIAQIGGNITLTTTDIPEGDNKYYTDALVSANTDVAANTAKVGYTDALVSANTDVAANTAKVGYTDALVSANTDVAANTAKVGVTTHAIGDSFGGGIVFFVYDGGQHGLIAATADQPAPLSEVGAGFRWYGDEGTYTNTRAKADGIGAGLKNTAIIIANQAPGDGGAFAATVCNEYSVTVDGVTYGDWYLPSKHELNLLRIERAKVGGLSYDYYWSSTEYDSNYAWAQIFYNGEQNPSIKHTTDNRVRAVRAF
jgi:hypothetical protein